MSVVKPSMLVGVAGGAFVAGLAAARLCRGASDSDAAAEPAKPAAKQELPAREPCAAKVETRLIDGKAIAAAVRAELKDCAIQLEKEHGVRPGLAVVLVGTRKDSQSYVRNKKKAAAEVNFHTVDVDLPETVSQNDLIKEIEALNSDPKVHAILVQLPLPKHIDEPTVLKAIRVDKDADGFSADNIGNLCLKGGDPPLAVPCTPAGCVELLQRADVQVSGKNAVVIGRSNIVGMPVASLLQSMDATVTVCHSRTKDMVSHIREADIVVAAIGKAEFVRGDWLKPGCAVIDVGINAIEDSTKKLGHRLVGDVNFAEAQGVASHITPVPGGVGPMTIAMLLKNTLNLARHSIGLDRVPLRRQSKPCPVPPPSSQAAGPAAVLAAAGADGSASPVAAGEDVAVVVSCNGSSNVWEAAVQAAALREKAQSVFSKQAPPAVVVQAGGGAAPVSLVTLGEDRRVLCAAATASEAAAALKAA